MVVSLQLRENITQLLTRIENKDLTTVRLKANVVKDIVATKFASTTRWKVNQFFSQLLATKHYINPRYSVAYFVFSLFACIVEVRRYDTINFSVRSSLLLVCLRT